jgi:IS30 family transposase
MGKQYDQLSLEERCEIARLRADGQSIRKIAASLGRAASSVSRELKRNSGQQVGYRPSYADELTWARRWRGSRLSRQPTLREIVLNRLAMGWSPEQVSGRLALQDPIIRISHESIYRFIYAQIRRNDDTDWRHYLPRLKYKRGYRKRKRCSSVRHIKDRISIAERPRHIGKRRRPGHWEADSILFSQRGQSVLVAQERKSRYILLAKPSSLQAEPTAVQLRDWLAPLPAEMRRTLTQDNGPEFFQHFKVRDAIGIKTYFCDPHSPWQKGGIENANGRLRRFLPKNTDLASISHDEIEAIAQRCNNTPRKCLAYKTPAELFLRHLLHFKCESTPRLCSG